MKLKITLIALFVALSSTLFAITGTTTIMSNGIARSYIYYAPGASVNVNLPVMIVMHGDGGTAAGIRSISGFDAEADAQNFLVIYPNAIGGNWNRSADNVAGDACTGSANTSNDVLFISDLIDHLCSTYQINKNKVYASGHSAGGFMTYNLAIQLTTKIAAFAPVAGLLCGDNAFLTTAFAANAAVPIYHIHGDADNTVGYPDANNMPTSYGEWPLAAFGVESCNSDTYTSTVTLLPTIKRHVFCSGPKEVFLIQVIGGGHGWPSVAGYNAATAIYNFCNAYSLNLLPSCVVADVTAPVLTAAPFSPADNAVNVATNTQLSISFNENIALSAGAISLVNSSTSAIVQTFNGGTTSIAGGTLTFTLSANLLNNTNYHMTIANNAITDIAGNNFAGFSNASTWNFTTIASVDNTPPQLAAPQFSPIDNEINVALSSQFTFIFDEFVAYSGGSISIVNTALNTIHETFAPASITVFGGSITLTLTTPLLNNTAYHFTVANNAIADLSGNAFAGFSNTTTYNINTGSGDLLPPTITAFSPADNSSNVPINTTFSATFNENVFFQGGIIRLYDAATNTIVSTFDIINSNVMGNVLNISFGPDLSNNTSYYILFENNAIADASGNNFAGISNTTTWNFTTSAGADVTPPALILNAFLPTDNATGITINSNLEVTFNEAIFAGGGLVKIYNGNTNALEETVDIFNLTIAGNTLVINPLITFANNTPYYVIIEPNTVKDLAENFYAGYSSTTIWNFTTVAVSDVIAPVLSATPFSPIDNAINVGINTPLSVAFNENIALSAGAISIVNTVTSAIVQTFNAGTANISGSTLNLILSASLANNTAYHITIANNAVFDLAGNNFAGFTNATTWNFMTIATVDNVGPILAAAPFLPADGASGVGPNPIMRVTFNENIAFQIGDVILYNTLTGATVQSFNAAAINVLGNILNLTLANSLSSNTNYHVNITSSAINDLSGNNFLGFTDVTTWNFSTGDFASIEEVSPIMYAFDNQNMIISNTSNSLKNVKLINLAGQVVFESKVVDAEKVVIETSTFTNQMIIIVVETDGRIWTKKLVF